MCVCVFACHCRTHTHIIQSKANEKCYQLLCCDVFAEFHLCLNHSSNLATSVRAAKKRSDCNADPLIVQPIQCTFLLKHLSVLPRSHSSCSARSLSVSVSLSLTLSLLCSSLFANGFFPTRGHLYADNTYSGQSTGRIVERVTRKKFLHCVQHNSTFGKVSSVRESIGDAAHNGACMSAGERPHH